MAGKISTVTIQILADAKKAIADLGRVGSAAKTTGDDIKKTGDHAATSGGRFTKLSDGMKLAVSAAAGLVAVKVGDFLRDAAEAAIEDQKSQELLALTLQNVTGATDMQVESTEAWIDGMARSKGVADDQLRPALANLVRATGDVEIAQDQLGVAMDIAAARGLDLNTVTLAMSKAALGNVGALGRLGIATKNTSGEMLTYDEVLQEASRTMGGAAMKAANTLEGQMKRLKIVWEEQQETLGTQLLPILSTGAETLSFFLSGFAGPEAHAIDAMATRMSTLVKDGIDPFADKLRSATAVLVDANRKAEITAGSVGALTDMFSLSLGDLQTMRDYILENAEALDIHGSELDEVTNSLNIEIQALKDQGRGLGDARNATQESTRSEEELAEAAEKAAEGHRKLIEKLDLGTEALYRNRDATQETSDAMLGLRDATQDQADAQAAVTEAVETYGQGSAEHVQAVADLAAANESVNSALRKIVESGPITRDEWVKQQTALGLAKEDAELLADELERINAFDPDPINFVVTVNGRKVAVDERGTIGAGSGGLGFPGKQHGGPVKAGGTYLVGEDGPEIVTMGGNGYVTPNHQLGGSGAMVAFYGPVYGMDDFEQKVTEAVKRSERRGRR